jgi:hypothetical protein
MCFFQTRVARVQKVIRDVILQWEPLLAFVHARSVLFGIIHTETTVSFIHRVRTAHVWTQGLTEDDFIDQVNDNSDLISRVEHQIFLLRGILADMINLRNDATPNEHQLKLNVLAVYKVLFPIDRRNQFAVSNASAMYQTLRSTRLPSSHKSSSVEQWPMVRPDPSNTVMGRVFL